MRPAVAGDGGDIRYRGFKDGIVFLTLQGACSGCPSSTATLKHGIEGLLNITCPRSLKSRRLISASTMQRTIHAPAISRPCLSADALDQIFREARTYNGWLDKPVSDEQLHAIYDLLKMGPTSANMQPARIVWVKSTNRRRCGDCASDGNKRQDPRRARDSR